jgi:uncharacterized membrane protein YphA (DoxX/SURF4 family)
MKHKALINTVGWVCRLVVGAAFILSGFTKAIDPWGTLYKVDDYLSVMNIMVSGNMEIAGVFSLILAEFFIGVFILTGCFRRWIPILALAMMCFMLPLSAWIAIANPVSDCGCFGDAWIISNTATFAKNICLTLAIIFLIKYNKQLHWVITPALQWIFLILSAGYLLLVALVGYNMQPLIDFRAYKVGTPIISDNDSNAEEFEFVYEKDGKYKVYNIDDDMPDEESGWNFVERRQKALPTSTLEQKSLTLWTIDDEEEVTEDVILTNGEQLILFMPSLGEINLISTWPINAMYNWCSDKDIDMIAVVSASREEIDEWQDLSMAEYPIYLSDDTVIKEIVRGNPAVVFLRDGKIVWKTSLSSINNDDLADHESHLTPDQLPPDTSKVLPRLTGGYLIGFLLLAIFSFSTYLSKLFRIKKKESTEVQ